MTEQERQQAKQNLLKLKEHATKVGNHMALAVANAGLLNLEQSELDTEEKARYSMLILMKGIEDTIEQQRPKFAKGGVMFKENNP